MPGIFLPTLLSYSRMILPWFVLGIGLAYFIEDRIKPKSIRHYFRPDGMLKTVMALVIGMVSPLSIMSMLPIANEIVTSGASPGLVFAFLVAERAYDLQSFFVISSLFGPILASLNAVAILLSLLAAAYVIKHEKIRFPTKKRHHHHDFLGRQFRLLTIVSVGILAASVFRTFIPADAFTDLTGTYAGGLAGGAILGFLLYFGPILGNYPVARAMADLGMSPAGVLTFLTLSPVVNIVVILLFGAAVGFRNTLRAFAAYGITALIFSALFGVVL